MRRFGLWAAGTVLAAGLACAPPRALPASAVDRLTRSLEAARPHASHVWRDTPPMNSDGTVNAYIEIPRDERRKWEFAMDKNTRAADRVMPDDLGGYPVNYGFVPQTISYDGDPFDVLALGPALPGGTVVPGVVVGVMFMEDEKGPDSKTVVSPLDAAGQPAFTLSAADRTRIADYFARYKRHEPGKFSKVSGWGSVEQGIEHVRAAHRFFLECPAANGRCILP